ncbi:uncharacterized protein B0H64DRAFT_370431 [Chaetomium fimeti]|uniref:Uncharacterized protein n=1 Tax=Chaetomium fimeti TaxID=1854472 RepID=A0AAE0HRV0_9PEZI|nr:hypothetical protein B0H64DRAFT_370431 [Chaetomium fimeti]
MCEFEEFYFTCGHSVCRLKSYCHSARNQVDHLCNQPQILRERWHQGRDCDPCVERARQAWAAYYQSLEEAGQGQGQNQGQGQGQDQGQGQGQGQGQDRPLTDDLILAAGGRGIETLALGQYGVKNWA